MPIDGSERVIPCDTVVVAVGTRANPLLTSSSQDLALTSADISPLMSTG